MNWLHIVGFILMLSGVLSLLEQFAIAALLMLGGAVVFNLGIKRAEREKREREERERERMRMLNRERQAAKTEANKHPAHDGIKKPIRSDPTAQNAYIFNLDYINTCKSIFIAFDIETTGLNHFSDKIIELSAVRYEDYAPCETFTTLINPQRPIPADASKINHIYDADVVNAPLERDALKMFCNFIGENALKGEVTLVAHNAATFDIKFLLYALSRSGIEANLQFQDTLYMCRHTLTELPNHKLQTVAEHFGIIQKEAHRAEDDVRTCSEIFVRLLQAKEQYHNEKLNELSAEEIALCKWLKNIVVEAELNTQLLTFASKSYFQFRCFAEVARFKTKAKKPYALIPKDMDIPNGIDVAVSSKAESEKYLRVYFTSPDDLTPLKQYYIDAYRKAFASAESYIGDHPVRMKTVAKQIDSEICI